MPRAMRAKGDPRFTSSLRRAFRTRHLAALRARPRATLADRSSAKSRRLRRRQLARPFFQSLHHRDISKLTLCSLDFRTCAVADLTIEVADVRVIRHEKAIF